MPYVINTSSSDSRSVSRDFDPQIAMDYFRLLAGTRPMTTAERAAVPKRLRVGKPQRGGIPHILGWSVGPWIISPPVHDIIEELEPGVQDFGPIELVAEKDNRSLGTYFLTLPPPKLNAIIAEETEFASRSMLLPRGACALDASIILGHRGEAKRRWIRPISAPTSCATG